PPSGPHTLPLSLLEAFPCQKKSRSPCFSLLLSSSFHPRSLNPQALPAIISPKKQNSAAPAAGITSKSLPPPIACSSRGAHTSSLLIPIKAKASEISPTRRVPTALPSPTNSTRDTPPTAAPPIPPCSISLLLSRSAISKPMKTLTAPFTILSPSACSPSMATPQPLPPSTPHPANSSPPSLSAAN